MTASLKVQTCLYTHMYILYFPIINLGNKASGRQPLCKWLHENLPSMTPYGVSRCQEASAWAKGRTESRKEM
jgi:hypothetical protein